MNEHIGHKFATLHQSLLHGKLPRSLHWDAAVELIEHLGTVEPHGGSGNEFAFTVGTQRDFFKRPHTHDLGIEDVSRLRKLLKEAAVEPAASTAAQPHRMVVVIDHHSAHVYQDHNGSRPEAEVEIKPYDPFGFHRHLIHRRESHYQGDRVPEETSFYEEVAKALVPANEIVLIGHGVGKSSAVDVLVEYLKHHYPDVSRRVKATETADLSALTEPEVEAIAKRHMIAVV